VTNVFLTALYLQSFLKHDRSTDLL